MRSPKLLFDDDNQLPEQMHHSSPYRREALNSLSATKIDTEGRLEGLFDLSVPSQMSIQSDVHRSTNTSFRSSAFGFEERQIRWKLLLGRQ